VAEEKIERLDGTEMSAERRPDGDRRQRWDGSEKPGAEDRDELCENEMAGRVGQLHEQPQGAGFLFVGQYADGNEGKQQRHRDVEPAEGRHQHAVERRQAGGECR